MVLQTESSTVDAPSAGTSAAEAIDCGWAWAPYEPDDRWPWSLALAGHLYRRAAFGADWDQLQQALADGPQRTVDRLLQPAADVAAFNRTYDQFDVSAAGSDSTESLRAWWLRRMIYTPHPLLEKMTLFWHSHFGASNAAVKNASLMQRHVQLLRTHALGSFRPMLEAAAQDPAVLISVGADANRKALPNDKLARSLMETFAMGPGHVTEEDVREAARALTGWFVLSGKSRQIPREHDDGVKRIFGKAGNFTGTDTVRLVLEHPATPQSLVRKIYGWLISEFEPVDDRLLAPLAESFAQDYDVRKLVETILRSNLFYSPAAYRRRIKCPVEYALGMVKGLEGIVSTTQLGQDLANLGQDLYRPPTVKGWAGGRRWINRITLLRRHNLAAAMLSGTKPYDDKLRPDAIAEKQGHKTPQSAGRFLIDLFLQGDLEEQVAETLLSDLETSLRSRSTDRALRRFTYGVVTLPEFQLV